VPNPTSFSKLLAFLERLQEAKSAFNLKYIRNDTICVVVEVPGQKWEVEFFEDGAVEIEIFKSDGEILDESAFEKLWPLTE